MLMQCICRAEANQNAINQCLRNWLFLIFTTRNSPNILCKMASIVPYALLLVKRQDIEMVSHIMSVLVSLPFEQIKFRIHFNLLQ